MADEITTAAATAEPTSSSPSATWPSFIRWIPTSTDHIIASQTRLLSLVKTGHVVELVDIGKGRCINTVTFDSAANSPTMVLVHGYGASQGFFFRNFDALARHFRVIAVDQLGWGGSSRPDFVCTNTEQTEAWFIESFEAWRKAKNINNFILVGHSFGGYVAANYALKHPERVQHLILVGSAGFSAEEQMSERMSRLMKAWQGAVLNHLWGYNLTPQKFIRGLGPWGPHLVRTYTRARFCSYATGEMFTEEEATSFADHLYHTVAAKASGELCLKYIFSFGPFARKPLLHSASKWKVPTTFIYGYEDWMSYQGAQQARKDMKVPCEIIRVPQVLPIVGGRGVVVLQLGVVVLQLYLQGLKAWPG